MYQGIDDGIGRYVYSSTSWLRSRFRIKECMNIGKISDYYFFPDLSRTRSQWGNAFATSYIDIYIPNFHRKYIIYTQMSLSKITQFYKNENGYKADHMNEQCHQYKHRLQQFKAFNQLSSIDLRYISKIASLEPEFSTFDSKETKIAKCVDKAQYLRNKCMEFGNEGVSPVFEKYMLLHIDHAEKCAAILKDCKGYWQKRNANRTKEDIWLQYKQNIERLNNSSSKRDQEHRISRQSKSDSRNRQTEPEKPERSRQKPRIPVQKQQKLTQLRFFARKNDI